MRTWCVYRVYGRRSENDHVRSKVHTNDDDALAGSEAANPHHVESIVHLQNYDGKLFLLRNTQVYIRSRWRKQFMTRVSIRIDICYYLSTIVVVMMLSFSNIWEIYITWQYTIGLCSPGLDRMTFCWWSSDAICISKWPICFWSSSNTCFAMIIIVVQYINWDVSFL